MSSEGAAYSESSAGASSPASPRLLRRFALDRFGLAGSFAFHLLGGRRCDDVDHQELGIRHQGDTGRQRDRAGGELRADVRALDGDGDLFGDRLNVGLDLDAVGFLCDQSAGNGFAFDDDVDLDGHLLAAAHDKQVGVLDVAANRVDVECLRQRELLVALDVEGEHGVRAGVTQHGREVVGVKLEVLRVGPVAVEDRGNPAVAPGATRCALAGLASYGSGQIVGAASRSLGHDVAPVLPFVCRARPGSQLKMRDPVDNGGRATLAVTRVEGSAMGGYSPNLARTFLTARKISEISSGKERSARSEREFGVRELLG